ncbi:MAG TPA: peptidoglycan DD-metalloendopeptidase family protein [Gaiellaceae bacterium]|nr:peptidoglycan DD-metalloendopeptidase family protein [Gaiellaceae bacterium]
MTRRALAPLVLGLVLVFAGSASGQGIDDEKAAVDARIAALRAEIEASKRDEGVLTSQLSAITSELGDAQAAVATSQSTLTSLEGELASARARLLQLAALLAKQKRDLERLEAEHARAVQLLEEHVRAIYIDGPPDMLSFLVSATSLDELIDTVEYLGRIGKQDRRIARQVERAKTRAAEERRATAETRRLQARTVSTISARTSEARLVRDHLAGHRETLAQARSLKQSALTDSRESREDFLHEVEALEAQSAALAARIQAAQSTAAPSTLTSSGFIWPVNGPVVSGFGMRWGRMHEGIDITAASGTPIWAAAAGTVIHAGWLGGYGNLVVVDHGGGLATAYAHASSILVGVGQSVVQGQTIALVGSTGNSSGPHLHFEVRVNGSAVDPLAYL